LIIHLGQFGQPAIPKNAVEFFFLQNLSGPPSQGSIG
jgi:hypothetical protein